MRLDWMYWTLPSAIFFATIFLMICGMTGLGTGFANHRAHRLPEDSDHAGNPVFRRTPGHGLHSPGLARIDRLEPVVRHAHLRGLDHYRHALGMTCDESFPRSRRK